MTDKNNTNFSEILQRAITEPGKLKEVYTLNFHRYSFRNCLLAAFECAGRGITTGPIDTYKGWQGKNRQVKKGEKAITLCMPITKKVMDETGEKKDRCVSFFVFKRNWFVLSQTEGEDYSPEPLPEFSKEKAFQKLNIEEIPFSSLEGNSGGYAQERQIAINPLNTEQWRTLFHETAHVVLGHTVEHRMNDGERTPKDIKEIEAETVALLCCASLGVPGEEYSREYIQGWMFLSSRNRIPDGSARRIFKAVDTILRAGTI